MNKQLKLSQIPLLILGLTVILTACLGLGPPPVETEPVVVPTATPIPEPTGRGAGDTLRLLFWEAPTTLNPHLSGAVKDWEASRITYEPLASFNNEGEMIPFLAAEIPSIENGGVDPNGLWVIWKLKEDIQWSDGEPFTADDVKFTFEYITNSAVNSTSASVYQSVNNIELMDDHTVKVNFKEPTPSWSLPFVGIQGMILPRHKFEDYNGPNAENAPANILPVGTGPYRVIDPGLKPQEVIFLGSELIETNKIEYEPNPFFREEDKPYFSKIEFRGGGTVREAARSVLRDDVLDYAFFLNVLPTEELLALEEAGQGQIVSNLGGSVERILLNRTDPNQETDTGERSSLEFPHPFFDNTLVRQAFAHAVNRRAIAALHGPAGQPTDRNLVAPPQYKSPNSFYEYNLDKAAQLLDEAGWVDTNGDGVRDKDGVRMKVVYQATVGGAAQQTQEIIKADLESIGVEVELKVIDPSIMFGSDPSANPNNFWRFNADIQQAIYNNFSPDPTSFMQQWTCNQIPQQENNWTGVNIERWCSPAYDSLFQQATTELDPDKRRELFIEMDDMLIEDVVMIPMVHLAKISGANNSIQGIALTPWDTELWNVKDWRRSSP